MRLRLQSLKGRLINELQNRSSRNNVVFWNVPEGSERGMPMTEFIQGILSEHMKLEDAESIEIMRAHRSPTTHMSGASKQMWQRLRRTIPIKNPIFISQMMLQKTFRISASNSRKSI